MSVRPAIDPDSLARWDAVRDRRDPFASPEYIAALSATGVTLVTAGADDLVPSVLLARSRGPFHRAGLPPFTPYSPLVLSHPEAATPADDDATLRKLAETLATSFDDVRVHLPPQQMDVRALQWTGWTVSPLFTYRLTPAVAADPASWSSGPRRTFRRNRPEYDILEGAEHAAAVARLCARSYSRHGRRPPLSHGAMEVLGSRLAETGIVRSFVATDANGDARAGISLLVGVDISYYWMAGSEPGPAMTVLLGAVLERLAVDRVPLLDLVGANTPSIAEFKRRFNPELVPYHAARCTPSRAVRALRSLRGLVRS